jgi:hypothetical protein
VFASSRTAGSEFLVTDTIMWNWWYDRQGAIQTSGLSFVDDLPRFFILLFAWQRFTEEDWGIVPQGQPGRTFTCDNGVEFTFVRDQCPIHRPYGIVGRGTMVLRATSTSDEQGSPIRDQIQQSREDPDPRNRDAGHYTSDS